MPDWRIEIEHKGLNKTPVITGNDRSAIEKKAAQQQLFWEREWLATVRTRAAREEIQTLKTVLATAICSESEPDWDSLKVSEAFPEPPPVPPREPELPPEPAVTDPAFRLSWIGRLLTPRGEQERRVARARREWMKQKSELEGMRAAYAAELTGWEGRRREFLTPRVNVNKTVKQIHNSYNQSSKRYFSGEREWILSRITSVLSYHSFCTTRYQHKAPPTEYNVSFVADSGVFIVSNALSRL